MWNTRTLSIAAVSLALLAAVIVLLLVKVQDKPAVAMAHVEYGPITLAANCVGDFASGRSWYLSINSAGQAELTISGRAPQQFQVPQEDWTAFRKALLDERFFELADEYGEHVADGSSRAITVTAGDITKTVRLWFLMNWVQSDRKKLVEPSRALRLLMSVRGWISDAEAVDLRPYDQKVLDAAGR